MAMALGSKDAGKAQTMIEREASGSKSAGKAQTTISRRGGLWLERRWRARDAGL
jgi:hypothetical protein